MSDVLGKKSKDYYTKEASEAYERSSAMKKIQEGMTLDALQIVHFKKGLILDLGCGTGFSTRIIQDKGFDAVGVDNNENMALIAKNKGIEKIALAEITSLPFKNKTFTGIISISTLQWLGTEQHQILLEEMKRVLAPGGKIIIQYYPESRDEEQNLAREAKKTGFKTSTQEAGEGRKKKKYIILY